MGSPRQRRNWHLQRAYRGLLSFLQLLWPISQHRSRATLRRRNFSGVGARHEPTGLPLWPVGLGTSPFREPEGRAGDAPLRVREVEAKNCVGRQPESDYTNRAVWSHEFDQLGD